MRGLLLTSLFILVSCAPPSSMPNSGLSTPVGAEGPAVQAKNDPSAAASPIQFVAPSSPDKHKDRFEYAGKFNPHSVSLKCKPGLNCPTAVGVLLFAMHSQDGKTIPLELCTASLIGSDKIVTAEHCDFVKDAESAYFISRTDIKGGARISRIGSVAYNQFKLAQDPKYASGYPDIAVMTLRDPISDLKPFELAHGLTKNYTKLTSWVVQHGETNTFDMTLDSIECLVHTDGYVFPFHLSEAPAVLRVFDCSAQGGNSGAALLADGLVEAILDARAETSPTERKNILATNVRCTDYPSQTPLKCIQPTYQEINTRLATATHKIESPFTKGAKQQPLEPGADFAYTDLGFQLSDTAQVRYEVFSFPTCRSATWDMKTVRIYSRIAYVTMDDWNNPKIVYEGEKVESTGQVQRYQNDNFMFKFNWNYTPARLMDPSADLRTKYGAMNSFALPLCGS